MTRNKRQNPRGSLKVQNVAEYLNSIKVREKALFCCCEGNIMFLIDGKYFDREEFNRNYPILELQSVRPKGDNPDKTKEFIRNKKSY